MRILARLALALLGIFLIAGTASAQTLTTADCLGCHNDPAAEKRVDQKKFEASIHGQAIGCTDCHVDVKAYPHDPAPKAVNCAACHADQVTEYAKSAHAKARAKGDTVAATCVDCHGKHDILPKSDPASRTNRFNIPRTCAGCHESAKATNAHPLPSKQVIE